MDQHYFSVDLGDSKKLCLAPLTDTQIENSGQEIADCGGYFLFERDVINPNRIEIIAKIVSEESVFRLKQVFNME